MKILWIINGLTSEQKKEKKILSFTMASWIEALKDNLLISKNTFDILYPTMSIAVDEFIENNVRYIPFYIKGSFKEKKYNFDQYDVIHIWGLEYKYVHKLINILDEQKLMNKTIISIQGICEYIGKHYCDCLPKGVIKQKTLRDLIKKDGIFEQQRRFIKSGKDDKKNFSKIHHMSGRTTFDEQYVSNSLLKINYYNCAEALRKDYYNYRWQNENCKKNRIFLSQGYYSIKGLHIALNALYYLKKEIPEVELVVAGLKPYTDYKWKDTSYGRYIRNLIKEYELEGSVTFLGQLSREEMVQEYLKCNVFIMPSLIENSPNSLCEAMMMGVPIVASYVGGISDLIQHGQEGYLYQWNAPYMLKEYIKKLLNNNELCEKLSKNARGVALQRHDISRIIERWDEIYECIGRYVE